MTADVEMTHETLPGRSIRVAPAEVPHHERAGWRTRADELDELDDDNTETENDEDGCNAARRD